jgi:hypothetical protein
LHPWLTPPAMGLFTAVIAGFISGLGGSRVQIGGPTAAFMPLVFSICATHGYEGLVLATCMAGVILILLGAFRFGGVIKFVPYPVTAGFTAGIGTVILASQIKDFFGLTILTPEGKPATIPADFVGKLMLFAAPLPRSAGTRLGIGAGVARDPVAAAAGRAARARRDRRGGTQRPARQAHGMVDDHGCCSTAFTRAARRDRSARASAAFREPARAALPDDLATRWCAS